MKHLSLLTILCIVLFSTCNKAVDVVMPTILKASNSQAAGDTIVYKLTGSVMVDGQPYEPDYINWSVEDNNANTVSTIVNNDVVKFVANDIGNYTISAKVGYDGNKSITVFTQTTITLSAAFMQQKLIGNWIGTAHNFYGTTWSYTFEVDSNNGHYFAMNTTNNIPCFTWYGEGNDNIHTPLKRLVINNVLNDRATGYLYTFYGIDAESGYAVPYEVKELRFSNNYTQLEFEYFPDGDQHYVYTMQRQ